MPLPSIPFHDHDTTLNGFKIQLVVYLTDCCVCFQLSEPWRFFKVSFCCVSFPGKNKLDFHVNETSESHHRVSVCYVINHMKLNWDVTSNGAEARHMEQNN